MSKYMMKPIRLILTVILVLVVVSIFTIVQVHSKNENGFFNKNQKMDINLILAEDNSPAVYKEAYPKYIAKIENNYIIWKDGTKMVFDDGIENKTFEQKLKMPDLEDQISMHYPAGKEFVPPPPKNLDPGRNISSESFTVSSIFSPAASLL